MNLVKEIPSPVKRKDLHDISDRVHSLKSAIKFKLELESIMAQQEKLATSLMSPSVLVSVLSPFIKSFREKIYMRKIKCSELRMDISVKTKLRNTYHRNEMELEMTFEEIYKDMEQNFGDYLNGLHHVKVKFNNSDPIPYQDVCKLIDKYKDFPPTVKTDKLSFFLAMENTLYSVNNPDQYQQELDEN